MEPGDDITHSRSICENKSLKINVCFSLIRLNGTTLRDLRNSVSPLNLTSSTSLVFSIMSPLGLKVWQGQCTLISRPRLVSEEKPEKVDVRSRHVSPVETNSFILNELVPFRTVTLFGVRVGGLDVPLTSVH